MMIFRGQVLRDHVVNSVEISQLLMIELRATPRKAVQRLSCGITTERIKDRKLRGPLRHYINMAD